MATEDKFEHARENAKNWLEGIQEMVDRLNHAQECDGDFDTCGLVNQIDCPFSLPDDNDMSGGPGIRMRQSEYTIDEYHDQDKACEAIEESVLELSLSGEWHIGETPEASRYEILLTTGGPALRIVGNLNQYNEPSDATMEMQDWFTPWKAVTYGDIKEYPGGTAWQNADADRWLEESQAMDHVLLTFAQQFYYGE